MDSTCSEPELVMNSLGTEAIGKLAADKRNKVLRFLRRYEHDADILEDLVQEVFLAALKSSSSFQGRSSPETWLLGIALNIGRGHRARMASQRSRFNHVALEDADADPAGVITDFMDSIEAAQYLARVEELVTKMPAALAMTFNSLYGAGLSYQETADALGIPIGTVRSRVSRMRELLQGL